MQKRKGKQKKPAASQTHSTSYKDQQGHQQGKCASETWIRLWLTSQMRTSSELSGKGARSYSIFPIQVLHHKKNSFKKAQGRSPKQNPNTTRFVPLGLRSQPLKVYGLLIKFT